MTANPPFLKILAPVPVLYNLPKLVMHFVLPVMPERSPIAVLALPSLILNQRAGTHAIAKTDGTKITEFASVRSFLLSLP